MQPPRKRQRRKLKAEINVVPYIDVMLVLLIIFMVTAPLLRTGVDIKLPQTSARALKNDKQPVLVSLDKNGQLYLTLGASKREPIDAESLKNKVSAFVKENPQVPVMFGGDEGVEYGRVMQAMVLLQQAGVPNIGLMTQPQQPASNGNGRN